MVIVLLGNLALASGYTGLTDLQIGYYYDRMAPIETSLVVDRVADDSFHFILYSENSLARKCLIDGNATYRKGVANEAEFSWSPAAGQSCRYSIDLAPAGLSLVTIKTDRTTCQWVCDKAIYLGHRTFKFQYPGCSERQIVNRRKDFQSLYDHKKFEDAFEILHYTYDHCLGYIEPRQEAWLYSDLAITALKKGAARECLRYIDEYNGIYSAPTDQANKALQINKKLCIDALRGVR